MTRNSTFNPTEASSVARAGRERGTPVRKAQASTRSFDEHCESARALVAKYTLRIQPAIDEDNHRYGYVAQAYEHLGAPAFGETRAHAIALAEALLIETVANMLAEGTQPPQPGDERLTEQMNVRLSARELEDMRAAAGDSGETLGDFARNAMRDRAAKTPLPAK